MEGLPNAAGSNPVVEIDVLIKNHSIVIPRLTWPEPDPTGSSNKSPNNDQEDPHQEAPTKHAHSETALPQRVVTIAEWVGVDVRKNHQSDHDNRRHDNAGNPGIK